MKKRVLSLTALVLIGLSSTFGSTFSAKTVTGKTMKYQNRYCPDSLKNTYATVSNVNGGTMHYGCYSGSSDYDKPWTEYKKNTSSKYAAQTSTPNGTRTGGQASNNNWAAHSEHSITTGGTVEHAAIFY